MKKVIVSGVIALLLGLGLAMPSNKAAQVKADPDPTPDFTEDFESYEVGDMDALSSKWTNAYFKHLGDGDEAATKNKFDVQADPENPSNKVLYVHTYESSESFFYNTMKDIYCKDFRLTYKYYQKATHNATPWTGFNFRKPDDGRYNGVTNVMMVIRAWNDTNFGSQMYRCVGDSFMNVPDGTTYYGPGGAGTPSIGVSDVDDGLTERWHEVKIEAIGTHFAMYFNNNLLGQADIDKKTANNYGYVSLVSCVCDAYYDDIHLENLDEEPYNAGGGSGGGETQAPTMETKDYTVQEGQDLVITCDTHGEAITSFRRGTEEVLPQYYEVNGNEITISKDYLTTLTSGKQYFIIQTSAGTVSFTITVSRSGGETPTPTPEPSDGGSQSGDQSGEEAKAKICGGSIVASSILLSTLSLAGVGLLVSKKRKK